MGSVDGYSVCPQCGAVMTYNCWYHSNSYTYDCNFCGWSGRKMIHYEDCLSRIDKGVDIDGYSRGCSIGHGVVRTNHSFGLKKTADDTVIPLSEGDELYYETWTENGRLKKIKLTQTGFDHFTKGMYIVIAGDKKYLQANTFERIRQDEVQNVLDNMKLSKRILDFARAKEANLYQHGIEAFLAEIDNKVRNDNGLPNANGVFSPFMSMFGEPAAPPDEDAIKKAKAEFEAKYKTQTGEDFDFESFINHDIHCPEYGLANNVCTGKGMLIDIDMTDVRDYYGVLSETSGTITCFGSRMSALRHLIQMLLDFFYMNVDVSKINDYSIVHIVNGDTVEKTVEKTTLQFNTTKEEA